MKQVNLILQSKGGVGKSLLTWFLANRYSDENVLFMDVDESTYFKFTFGIDTFIPEKFVLSYTQ
jgi:cellulose biosynthesis protein BcsQ